MKKIDNIQKELKKHGGVLKTSELNDLGLSSRQIKKLLEKDVLTKIKQGFYELSDNINQEEAVIARLFPHAVIFLENALIHYGYTDRIPLAWQIAVDKNSKKSQCKINYPLVEPYFVEPRFLGVGLDIIEIEGVIEQYVMYFGMRINLKKKYLIMQFNGILMTKRKI